MEESDGVSSTQTTVGSDTVEGTQNTTVLVQMEEEERAIRVIPFRAATLTEKAIQEPREREALLLPRRQHDARPIYQSKAFLIQVQVG